MTETRAVVMDERTASILRRLTSAGLIGGLGSLAGLALLTMVPAADIGASAVAGVSSTDSTGTLGSGVSSMVAAGESGQASAAAPVGVDGRAAETAGRGVLHGIVSSGAATVATEAILFPRGVLVPPRAVAVGADGSFEARNLAAGCWEVLVLDGTSRILTAGDPPVVCVDSASPAYLAVVIGEVSLI